MMQPTVELFNGDCLDILPTLAAGSIDAILTDLPYGTTACVWDEIIPFAPMWEQVKRVLKPRGVFVTTASQPFTSKLVMSNLKWFKYEWIWLKERGVGFQIAKYRPLMETENIAVFCGASPIYNPQRTPTQRKVEKWASSKSGSSPLANINKGQRIVTEREPTNLLCFARDDFELHPTQKPVSLYTYLTLTYTNEGETVLDFCAGSGTSGVSAITSGRNFIGIEKDAGYYQIMQERIAQTQMQPRLEGV